jgi:hypothetical protein
MPPLFFNTMKKKTNLVCTHNRCLFWTRPTECWRWDSRNKLMKLFAHFLEVAKRCFFPPQPMVCIHTHLLEQMCSRRVMMPILMRWFLLSLSLSLSLTLSLAFYYISDGINDLINRTLKEAVKIAVDKPLEVPSTLVQEFIKIKTERVRFFQHQFRKIICTSIIFCIRHFRTMNELLFLLLYVPGHLRTDA